MRLFLGCLGYVYIIHRYKKYCTKLSEVSEFPYVTFHSNSDQSLLFTIGTVNNCPSTGNTVTIILELFPVPVNYILESRKGGKGGGDPSEIRSFTVRLNNQIHINSLVGVVGILYHLF